MMIFVIKAEAATTFIWIVLRKIPSASRISSGIRSSSARIGAIDVSKRQIHDISCVGRCSLTAVLPLLSAAGIETDVIPTAVLSTHTGGFSGYTYRDLTEDMLPIAEHWSSLGLTFDAIYTGYIGTPEQLTILNQIVCLLKKERTLLFVDPVMADNGTLYKCCLLYTS